MKKNILIFLNILFLLCTMRSMGQMNICVYAANDSLHFLYKPDKDYHKIPDTYWNSQLVTVRYPKSVTLTWGGITQLSKFSWEEDPQTPGAGKDGNDGYWYKTFYSANTPFETFLKNEYKKVFRVKYNASQNVVFEPITNNPFTELNHLNAAVNNAVEPGVLGDGNVFKVFTTDCIKAAPIDSDGDGVLSDVDPDDKDACNPHNVIIAKVDVTPLSDCAKADGTIVINAQGTNLSYSINNGQNYLVNNIFSNVAKGNYTIWVKNDKGCQKKYAQNISIDCTPCGDEVKPTITLVNPILKNKKYGDTISLQCGYEPIFVIGKDLVAKDDKDNNPSLVFIEDPVVINPACEKGIFALMHCGWKATDKCGNQDSIWFYFAVRDTIKPTLVGIPADITLTKGASLPLNPQPQIIDKCDQDATIVFSETVTDSLVTRTWTGMDKCGNTTVKTQFIRIIGQQTTPDYFYLRMKVGEEQRLTMTSDDIKHVQQLVTVYEEKNNLTADISNFCGDNICYLNITGRQVGIERYEVNRCGLGGCDLAYVTVEITEDSINLPIDREIIVYTAFSPNDDNVNDFFTIKNIDKHEPNELIIYNRYGNEVFATQNYQNDWNGKNQNRPLPDGTYFYLLKLPDGKKQNGFVQIHR